MMPGAQNQPQGGGRRLLSKYKNVNDDFISEEPDVMPRDGYLAQQDDDSFGVVVAGRQAVNHPAPKNGFVSECNTAYCDKKQSVCLRTEINGAYRLLVCCDAANPETVCNDPPC